MSELSTNAENNALKAGGFKAFFGIDLKFIKSQVAEIAGHIGRDGIFAEYTRHDISHINQVLKSLDWIIPYTTATKMASGDWLMLVLSIYFHDLGMVVTKDEYNRRSESGFDTYKNDVLRDGSAEFVDKVNKLENKEQFLYQEFVRAKHAERIRNWIEGKPAKHLGVADVAFDEINKMLANLDAEFRADLGMVCESHHRDDLEDFKKYEIRRFYGSNEHEHVNLHYCALILRTADLLHITSDRTPSTEYRLINPSDPISQDEWAKQEAVKNVGPQLMRDENGHVIEDIQSNTVEITAKFKGNNGANGFFGLSSYIIYASAELKKNYEWNQKAEKTEGSKYQFPWNKIDDSKIRTEGFVPKRFEFSLDQGKILRLLVGHTLYNDSTVVMRELVQNSIDAIKLQSHIQDEAVRSGNGEIRIIWNTNTRILSIIDNGTGMTQEIIEEHLLKVGSSRYQSESFRKNHPDFVPISRFGIGILTCFLIADNVEIITSHVDEDEAKKLTIRNLNGKYLLQHLAKEDINSHMKNHGTSINLEVRADVDLTDLLEQLNRWVVFPVCPVTLTVDNTAPIRIGYDSPKQAMEKYLKSNDYEVDGINVKVAEDTINGVTLAYGLKFNSFYKEWVLIKLNDDRYFGRAGETKIGIGTCIEGIRVEFNSPGFIRGGGVFAIANASGENAPKTNVARSNIEAFNGDNTYLKSIYALYMKYIQEEVSTLQTKHRFSTSWAAGEVQFLLEPIASDDSPDELNSIADLKAFTNELENANLILVEREGKRFITSITALEEFEDVWVVDSSLFRSAESLLKEGKGSTALLELIKILNQGDSEETAHLSTLLCGFEQIGTMQKYALEKRTVGNVKIFPVERRVDVCWSKSSDNWFGILTVRNVQERRYPGEEMNRTFLIQSPEYNIDGIDDQSIIECFNLVFILKGSPIWEFFFSAWNTLDVINNEDDRNILEFMFTFMHSLYDFEKDTTSYTKKEITNKLNSSQERYVHRDLSEPWRKIERAAFIEALSSTTWKVFTPAAWNRYHSF